MYIVCRIRGVYLTVNASMCVRRARYGPVASLQRESVASKAKKCQKNEREDQSVCVLYLAAPHGSASQFASGARAEVKCHGSARPGPSSSAESSVGKAQAAAAIGEQQRKFSAGAQRAFVFSAGQHFVFGDGSPLSP